MNININKFIKTLPERYQICWNSLLKLKQKNDNSNKHKPNSFFAQCLFRLFGSKNLLRIYIFICL